LNKKRSHEAEEVFPPRWVRERKRKRLKANLRRQCLYLSQDDTLNKRAQARNMIRGGENHISVYYEKKRGALEKEPHKEEITGQVGKEGYRSKGRGILKRGRTERRRKLTYIIKRKTSRKLNRKKI